MSKLQRKGWREEEASQGMETLQEDLGEAGAWFSHVSARAEHGQKRDWQEPDVCRPDALQELWKGGGNASR